MNIDYTQSIITPIESHLVQVNIPVNLSFSTRFKELVHNFFRRPVIVSLISLLPSSLFGTYQSLASLVQKCHRTFTTEHPELVSKMEVKVVGGDTLNSLKQMEANNKNKVVQVSKELAINFTDSNCLDAAYALRETLVNEKVSSNSLGILSLGNRWQPGGVGLTPYSGSQEEFLVRRSCLAWGLDPRFGIETVHAQLKKVREEEGLREAFSHHIPYFGAVISKHVTFIDKENQQEFDIITAAAPDMRPGSDEFRFIQSLAEKNKVKASTIQHQILEDKIRAIFDAAIAENITNLVLGAFGCGCFKNDTEEVAQIFAGLLKSDDYKNKFENIIFSITDTPKKMLFEKAFNSVLQ